MRWKPCSKRRSLSKMPAPPKRILIIQLASLGDILQSSGYITALQRQTGAQIGWVVEGRGGECLVRGNPAVNAVYRISRNPLRLLWMSYLIWRRRYTHAVILHRNAWFSRWAKGLGIPERVGFFQRGVVLTRDVDFLAYSSMWERYAAVATLITGQPMGVQRPTFLPTDHFVPPPGKWIALAPFGGRNAYSSMTTKRWPYFPLLIEAVLAGDPDTQILLVGDSADAREWQQLGLSGTDRVHNGMGLLSIPALAIWLRHCTALVSNDSLALYLGLSQYTPVIGLFGPTQKTEFLPPIPGAHGLQAQTFCSPCYHPTAHRHSLAFACPFGVACMREVQVGDVLDILRNIY